MSRQEHLADAQDYLRMAEDRAYSTGQRTLFATLSLVHLQMANTTDLPRPEPEQCRSVAG